MTSGVNYMNPASFIPQAAQWQSGPLGGIQYAKQATDYDKLMEVQHFLQQLGAQQEEQKHKEFMAGAPIRALEGQLKGETLQGQIPGAREHAGALQRQGTAQANFQTDTQFSPEAKLDFFRQLKQRSTEDQWKNYTRELTEGGRLSQQALMIQHQQGDLAAQAYVQQTMQRLKAQGINLPEHFERPEMWKPAFETARDSISHLQKLSELETQGNTSRDVATIHANATRDAVASRASGEKQANLDQELVNLQRKVFAGGASPQEVQQYGALVFRKWSDFMTKDPVTMTLSFKASQPGESGIKASKELEARKNAFMNGYGVRQVGGPQDHGVGNPNAPAPQSKQPIKFGDLPKAK